MALQCLDWPPTKTETYRMVFLTPTPLVQYWNEKMPKRQQEELLFHEVLHPREPLVGSLAVFILILNKGGLVTKSHRIFACLNSVSLFACFSFYNKIWQNAIWTWWLLVLIAINSSRFPEVDVGVEILVVHPLCNKISCLCDYDDYGDNYDGDANRDYDQGLIL